MTQKVNEEKSVPQLSVHAYGVLCDRESKRFVDFYSLMREHRRRGEEEKARYFENLVSETLKKIYGWDPGRAILFLLGHVGDEQVREFAFRYLRPSWLQDTHVEVVVRCNTDMKTIRGNTGWYVICLRKDVSIQEQVLHFTNRSSVVYYLLFLLHRRRHDSPVPPPSLRKNRSAFIDLYQIVYGGSTEEASERYDKLIRRWDGQRLRAGRESEIIYDIRRHLRDAFAQYDESYLPYAMTANSHLTISPKKIILTGLKATHMQRLTIY